MKTFEELNGRALHWKRHKGAYELIAEDGEIFGTLRMKGWRNRAEVDVLGARVILKREMRWFRQMIQITSEGSEQEIATYTFGYRESTLTLPGGRVFHWRKEKGLFNQSWRWETPEGSIVVGFQPKAGLLSMGSTLAISPDAETKRGLPLLVALGWYMMLLRIQDASASVPVVVVSG